MNKIIEGDGRSVGKNVPLETRGSWIEFVQDSDFFSNLVRKTYILCNENLLHRRNKSH